MAELSKEVYEALPEAVQADYKLDGEVYRPTLEMELGSMKTSFKEKMDALDAKLKGTESEMSEIKAAKAAEIEAAKAEALEAAKSKGDVDDAVRIYQEQMEDLKTRSGETEAQYKARIEELEGSIKTSKRGELLAGVREKLGVKPESAKIFDQVVGGMITIDATTGKPTFLSDDGSATSLDTAGFISQLESDPAYKPLRQGIVPGQGGMANGSNQVAVPQVKNNPAEQAKKNGDLGGFLKASLNGSN